MTSRIYIAGTLFYLDQSCGRDYAPVQRRQTKHYLALCLSARWQMITHKKGKYVDSDQSSPILVVAGALKTGCPGGADGANAAAAKAWT